jgi:ankyrin repeat protein
MHLVDTGGASVNVTNSDGFTLLHSAILEGDSDGACFLLNHGAEIDLR